MKHYDHHHTTVAEARTCEEQRRVGTTITKSRPLSINEAADLEMAAMGRLRRHLHTTAERRAAVAPASYSNTRSINAPRAGYVRWASPAAEKFARDLIGKKAWQGVTSQQMDETMALLAEGKQVSAEACSQLISELKALPYVDQVPTNAPVSPAPQGRQRSNKGRIQELKAQVPDGRYAVDLPDGDKVKFFKVRTGRTGYLDIKHCVSDARYPWPFNRYEEVLEAIIAATPAAAGQRYADEYGQCYRCGRSLTDTNNPYKAVGLGPECGSK